MKRFNPEKELKKIQHGNKNKVIFGVIALLLIISIGSTYALYQIRYSKRIIYTKVADFSRDLNLAVYVDGEKQTEFPDKRDDIVYTHIDCTDNKAKASWDYNDWSLVIESKLPNKCNVYFETRWKDNSGAAYPELYQGLIPVYYDDSGNIHIADLSSEWYDYDEHEWANAVLVTNEAYKRIVKEDGTLKTDESISLENDILQMYVWIPRYRYKLWNAEYGTSEPQEIEIEFENNTIGRSMGSSNGEWLTHPAFLFGDTELNGFWTGKFQSSNSLENIEMKPNQKTIITTDKIYNTYEIFNFVRKVETNNQYNLKSSEIDAHIMKNSEWGAIAYLSHSKYGTCNNSNCEEVWMNNADVGRSNNTGESLHNTVGPVITGCSGTSASASPVYNSTSCAEGHKWNEDGVKASTTWNMYGVYDMSGAGWEATMGGTLNDDGTLGTNSGFTKETMPDSKYYDAYNYDYNTVTTIGHLGDALRETAEETKNDTYDGWNNDATVVFNNSSGNIICRGGYTYGTTVSGIFAYAGDFITFAINPNDRRETFRVVITAQDGTD